jgi:predicted nucleic acid-binding protein
MKPVFLDTSGVIALLHKGDVHHARATGLAAQFGLETRPKLTTTAILIELGDGFARKKRWDVISPFLAAIFGDPLVTIVNADADLMERARRLRDDRDDKDWGLTDSISFIVMSDHQSEDALTADRHFLQAGFRALLLTT